MTHHPVDRFSASDAPVETIGETSAFYRIGEQCFGGWVRDPASPDRRFVVEIRADGETLALVLAESFIPELRQRFGGDGCHGFVVLVDPARLDGAERIEAYLANSETCLGSLRVGPGEEAGPVATGRVAGELRWSGGLRLAGWACDVATPGQPLGIDILVDGEAVLQALPTRWRESAPGDVVPSGRFAFDACLPQAFADGRVHTVRALADGVELAGSPAVVLVHEHGFEGLATEIDPQDASGQRLRSQLLDRLMPAAIPLGEFEAWRSRFPVDRPPGSSLCVGVLVVGDGEEALAATLASLANQTHGGWFAVSLAAEQGAFSAAAFDHAVAELSAGEAEAVMVVEAGTILDPAGVAHLAASFEHAGAPGLVYADVVLSGPGGRRIPSFKPAHDRRRMMSQAYAADLFALSGDVFSAAAGFAPDSLYALLLVAAEVCDARHHAVGHLPQVLAQVPPRDVVGRSDILAAAVSRARARHGDTRAAVPAPGLLHPAVRFAPNDAEHLPPVSIIIPTRDRADLLEPCLDTLRRLTDGPDYEVIVVDNGSREARTRLLFERLHGEGGRVVPADMPFNYARLNRLGVEAARHELVLFLNNDIEVFEPGWLKAMVREIADPRVGIVGATLLWPSRLVQHGGVVLGPHFAAAHAFNDRIDGEGGFDDLLFAAREQSAVTAACLLMRKADFDAVGRMDEVAFPVAFNDVDLCLKVRDAGLSVVITPEARLLHKESASRGLDHLSHEKRSRARKETANLRERWSHVLAADPYYNPNLSLDLYPFSGLATPPRDRSLRFNQLDRW